MNQPKGKDSVASEKRRDADPEVVRYLEIAFPGYAPKEKTKQYTPSAERSAFFVPTDLLMRHVCFEESKWLKNVLLTLNTHTLLKLVLREGKVALRYGKDGLEDDLARQQIILYTAVVWRDYLLFYRRPEQSEVSDAEKKFLGDKRLRGKISVGFGGHKTLADLEDASLSLMFIGELFPGLMPEMSNVVGLNIGFLKEIQEELGIRLTDSKRLTLLGGFRDMRTEKPLSRVPVNHVHTAVVGVLELNEGAPDTLGCLRLPAHETAEAWWVPLRKLDQKFEENRRSFELWSEVMVREFIPRYLEARHKEQERVSVRFHLQRNA